MPLEAQGFSLASEWALEHGTRRIIEQAGSQMNPEILSCLERGTVCPSLPQVNKASALIWAILIHSRSGSLIPQHDVGWQQAHQRGKRDAGKEMQGRRDAGKEMQGKRCRKGEMQGSQRLCQGVHCCKGKAGD